MVYPNGETLVLDQDEFEDLEINTYQRAQACQALKVLLDIAEAGSLGKAIHQQAP